MSNYIKISRAQKSRASFELSSRVTQLQLTITNIASSRHDRLLPDIKIIHPLFLHLLQSWATDSAVNYRFSAAQTVFLGE